MVPSPHTLIRAIGKKTVNSMRHSSAFKVPAFLAPKFDGTDRIQDGVVVFLMTLCIRCMTFSFTNRDESGASDLSGCSIRYNKRSVYLSVMQYSHTHLARPSANSPLSNFSNVSRNSSLCIANLLGEVTGLAPTARETNTREPFEELCNLCLRAPNLVSKLFSSSSSILISATKMF